MSESHVLSLGPSRRSLVIFKTKDSLAFSTSRSGRPVVRQGADKCGNAQNSKHLWHCMWQRSTAHYAPRDWYFS